MKTKITTIITLTLMAALLAAFIPTASVSADALTGRGGPGGTQGNTQSTGAGGMGIGMPGTTQSAGTGGLALTPLTLSEAADLQNAILEEYGALNLYNAVMKQLGSVVPFSQIALSEQMHINALARQATRYGVSIPANPGLTAPKFASLKAACQAGVAAEIADADLYDELVPGTTHSDLLRVYQSLQNASLNSHLPAFETCQ
jgi:hypothetical protein